MSGAWWADRAAQSHRKPAARGAGARRPFGTTWWGRAWLEALEHQSGLDPNRLPRGRSYARSGAVGELAITEGTIGAAVQGSRATPYEVFVGVVPFNDAEWDRVLDAIAGRLGHAAALLDGELPPEIVDDVAAAGLSLLPTAGEVEPECSCPDWAVPCKHAAAVCYLVADVLDRDPFALLHLRGMEREAVLSALRARRGSTGTKAEELAAAVDDGVLARDAYAVWRSRLDVSEGVGGWTMPVPLPPPARPGRSALPVGELVGSGEVDLNALADLATDAAGRAWMLAQRTGDGGLTLTHDEDIARRADPALGTHTAGDLARAAGIPARELTAWARAWRHGGRDGLVVLRESWSPPAPLLTLGRRALQADRPDAVTTWRNRATQGRRQLRTSEDGRWWLFVKSIDQWDLAGPPADDPAAAIWAYDHEGLR